MPDTDRRVALVADAAFYVGPALARAAGRAGATTWSSATRADEPRRRARGRGRGRRGRRPACANLAKPESAPALVDGGPRAASAGSTPPSRSPGQIVTGRFVNSTLDDLRAVVTGCLEAPYHFLKAAVTPDDRAGRRPDPGHHQRRRRPPDARRAALLGRPAPGPRCSPATWPTRWPATGCRSTRSAPTSWTSPSSCAPPAPPIPRCGPRSRPRCRCGRLGTMEEFAAFCMPFIDGTSRFTTGQFVAYAGGWA